MDFLIPASKISNLNMGEVVGQIANDVGEYDGKYKLGAYNCKINLDSNEIKVEEKLYTKPPKYYNFGSEEEKEKILSDNYKKIKTEISEIIIQHAK